MKTNIIYNKSCLNIEEVENNSIDLTVTSPPYDNLRTYGGFIFDFKSIAKELYRVTKDGGVVVWVVGDATIKGSETGTSFKQALYFKDIGFNLHDTMIYKKPNIPKNHNRYEQDFEFMFVFSIGKPKTFNPIMIANKQYGRGKTGATFRHTGVNTSRIHNDNPIKERRIKGNCWDIDCGYMKSSKDKIAFQHPAIFPEKLAEDHILSWSNKNDIVLDPMFGSGTTLKIAKRLGRRYIGFEISKKYCKIAEQRLLAKKTLWD